MVTKTHVKSFYSGMLVTCYEYEGKKYVANQHGDFDIYEGEYVRGGKLGVLKANSEEMRRIIAKAPKQGR
jgi:hypothetical protein